jgi:Na+/melibiose symporter-like transporter
MGTVFAIATAAFVLVVVTCTFRWREDTRFAKREASAGWLKNFLINMRQILHDPNPRWVFVFIFVFYVGTVLVSSWQVFVYDDFMKFSGFEKSIVHGGTMVGMALGAFVSSSLAERFDKKGAVLLGGLISIISNSVLALLFVTGAVPPGMTWSVAGHPLPLALCIFAAFHAAYWFGTGIMLPIATAMIADVAELHLLRTGINKDGAYSSVFSLATRMAICVSWIASGYCLDFIGYKLPNHADVATQTPEAIWRLGFCTFVIGALICLVALITIRKYPISRAVFEALSASEAVAPQIKATAQK